jgi:hypothetical protein
MMQDRLYSDEIKKIAQTDSFSAVMMPTPSVINGTHDKSHGRFVRKMHLEKVHFFYSKKERGN